MCQQYEAERNYCIWHEKQEIKAKYNAHKSGEKQLTDEELKDLTVEMLMLMEE